MKKNCFLFFLIFIIFSCKGTPKTDTVADESGLSQLELTSEKEDGADTELDDEFFSDEDMPAQDGITDGSVIDEDHEEATDDFQADAQIEEQQVIVENIDEVEETPEEKNLPAPAITAAQPPVVTAEDRSVVTAEERFSVTDTPVTEQPVQEEQDDAQSESEVEQKTAPPRNPWPSLPPAVTAVKDDAPVQKQWGLVPPKEEEIVFSRIIRAMAGQLVEIPFRGTNWSYLEDIASRRGIVYDSRRNDSEGVSFIFRAEEAGTYTLKFYRRDYIRDYILNDYVQVIVDEPPSKNSGAGWFSPPADRGRVTAEPRWPSALDEAALLRGSARPASGAAAQSAPENKNGSLAAPSPAVSANSEPASSQAQGTAAPPQAASVNSEPSPAQTQGTGTAPPAITPPAVMPTLPAPETQTAAKAPAVEKQEKLPPEEIMKKAQDAFNEGNTAAAIALLDQYMEYYPDGSDEIYWLYGQFYEANTPQRNILLSLNYYRRLINEYPQSRRYNDARRRIAYLERFYINIQ